MSKFLAPNFCRKAVTSAKQMLAVPNVPDEAKAMFGRIIDLASSSKKFILPDGGAVMPDPGLKALDDDCRLRLPFQSVALEFRTSDAKGCVIVFAREWEGDEGQIACDIAMQRPDGIWVMNDGPPLVVFNSISTSATGTRNVSRWLPDIDNPSLVTVSVMVSSAVIGLINALECSNVGLERMDPEKQPKAKKSRPALPFDSYYVLTVGKATITGESSGVYHEDHRSPREHIRRGHIRRYGGGAKIWINSMVVGARKGAGKITKDYALRNRPPPHIDTSAPKEATA